MHSTLENYSKRRSRRIVALLILIIAVTLPLPSMANTVEERDDEPRKESIATNNPRFLSKGETRELREGESTRLECVVEDLGEFVILWRLNRTNVLFAGILRINRDERYFISSDGSMEIKGVDGDLSGEYSCQISTNPPQEIVYVIKVLSDTMDEQTSTNAYANPIGMNSNNTSTVNQDNSDPSTDTATVGKSLHIFLNFLITTITIISLMFTVF